MPAHKIEIVFITVVNRVAITAWRVFRPYLALAGQSKPGITSLPAHSCDIWLVDGKVELGLIGLEQTVGG